MTRSTWIYRCHTCGETLPSWAAAERHGDGHHGARIDIVAAQPGLLPVVDDVPTGAAP